MKRALVTAILSCVCALAWAHTGWAQKGHESAGPPNTLTSQEKKDGWTLLFDGKTLDQWAVTPHLANVWKAVDGTIKSDAKAGSGTLLTKEEFTNFEVKAEFRADPQINSGLMLRNPPQRPDPAPGQKPTPAPGGPGYEVQIRDKNPGKYSGGDFLTGSLVGIAKAPADATIIPGQWNSYDVTANGDHFIIIYNGRKVVETHDAKRASGTIGLQLAHPEDATDSNIEFRNLKIRRLGTTN